MPILGTLCPRSKPENEVYAIDVLTVRDWDKVEKIILSMQIEGGNHKNLSKGVYVSEVVKELKTCKERYRKNIPTIDKVLSTYGKMIKGGIPPTEKWRQEIKEKREKLSKTIRDNKTKIKYIKKILRKLEVK